MVENKLKQLELIAKKILPKGYELSIVFADSKLARNLNKKYRGKNYVPNVLSFPYSKKSGEIFLNLKQIKSDSKKFGLTETDCVKYMLIHGSLHLKGMEHSARMEAQEKLLLKKFKVAFPSHLKDGKKKLRSRN